jgi:superfamily II DNA or RNA helicase
MHAVLGHWTTNSGTPATVVMPTGTGKTETMLALLVAGRPERLLVLVPSDALRDQVASKFETLGVLQERGIVASQALRPVVGKVEHNFKSADLAADFARACNVIIATPQALHSSEPEALAALLENCSHLFVDEAHHVAAETWAGIRSHFMDKRVVQFTATPFREDGRHLQGKVIYAFPLREAQRLGYFSSIDYTSVIDFEDVDRVLAEKAIARLRDDLLAGYDHVLMVRVANIPRAQTVLGYYDALAPELQPVIINSRMGRRDQRKALENLRSRISRIIVCVNMLGEGFDLPALKIAAVHDPQKSLAITLQFIGRFARTSASGAYGPASIYVARSEIDVDNKLRALYAEDSDWNVVLRDLSDRAVGEQVAISEFEAGFTSLPDALDLHTLLPKLSAVAYRTPTSTWNPTAVVDFFGEENFLTLPIAMNPIAGVTWWVLERHRPVRWGDVRTIEEVTYELYIAYFDSSNRMLYVNNSANDGLFEELVEALVGPGAVRFSGSTVYRVMADIQRLVPTNVGVLDARDQFRRFSMHVGSDVTASFTRAEAGSKTQTNISGGGYKDGERVSISASIKGRIWTHATAHSLKHWRDWCDQIGVKLLDSTISIDGVIGQFILPESLTARPDAVLLGLEWPWDLHVLGPETVRLQFADTIHPAVYTDLVPTDTSRTGPFKFDVRTDAWSVAYEADVDEHGHLRYRCSALDEVTLMRGASEVPLSEWLNKNGLTLMLDGDRLIEGDLLFTPTWDRDPFDRDALLVLDWTGTDLSKESQKPEKREDSIQRRAIRQLLAEDPPWDLILDDDGSGEIADIVALRVDPDGLVVRLVHCKYAHGATPGARVDDLYEVCGQAQKSVAWRRSDLRPFFKRLDDRARRKQKRDGVSPFEAGSAKKLYEIREQALVLPRRMEIVIAQPGLSASRATRSQLDILGSTESYLRTTINAPLTIWCSS